MGDDLIKEQFQIHIIRRKEFFYKVMIYILFCLLLTLVSLYLLKSTTLTIIIVIALCAPVIVIPFLLNKLTKFIIIDFFFDYFIINQDDNKTSTKEFFLKEMRSYSVQLPTDKFSSIKFNMKDGNSFEYSFFQEKKYQTDVDTELLINSFHQLIKVFNESTTNKVIFVPSFYASQKGLVTILGLSVFLIFAIIFALSYSRKPVSFTFFFSFIIILQLVVKRYNELSYFKKTLNNLEIS